MPRLFGTDGVRGIANLELTAELALKLAATAAHVLQVTGAVSDQIRPNAIVGRDPRASGELLEAAVIAGLASAGWDVIRIGIIPTPGLAYLMNHLHADLGVMLSASHNPMQDNGIKFFVAGGIKLADQTEDIIQEALETEWERPLGADVGRVRSDLGAIDAYIAHLVSSLGEGSCLDGLKVVMDCANGAASVTAQAAFEAQGAEVIAINSSPDGLNINLNCGSTHLQALQEVVVAEDADLGVAFDGDADRCLAVDHLGEVVDGDQILAILAVAMQEDGSLHSDTVVATVMSNLGFFLAMQSLGIYVDQTKVGDRYVLEAMNANGFTLGGEQSGHVIMSEFATTGDGVLTALHIASRMVAVGKSLRELASIMTRYPQVLLNVSGVNKSRAGLDPELNAAVTEASRYLDGYGRVLLRPSGTEPVVRVMVEAVTQEEAERIATDLAEVVKKRLAY